MKNFIYFVFFKIGRLISPIHYFYNKFICPILDFIYTGFISRSVNISRCAIVRYPAVRISGPGISLGNNSYIGKYGVVTTWTTKQYRSPKIQIGHGTNIGQHCHITAINKIVIGDRVLTGKYVTITDNSHGDITFDELLQDANKREMCSKGAVVIEDNVWIGDKVTICPCVHIGKGSIIGANAVVTKDIPPYSIAVGNPIKIIKTFNPK